jgi:5,6-dimethylbenzimidazole synthase
MQEPFAQLIERTFSSAERTVIYRLIRSLQHVRHFASDPIPTDTLQRILDAAWYGSSARGQAPGQVILITSPALRTEITSVVHASNAGEASRLAPRRSPRVFWSHSSEHMTEAPLHLAVTYERGRGSARGIDLAPVPAMAIYSICQEMHNLWLASCAEGLGIEWVKLSNEGLVARLLKLPHVVQLIAYLCLGFPQEFHRRRARKAAGWCPRRGLDTLIYNNVWGRLCELFPAPRVTFDDHDHPRQSE